MLTALNLEASLLDKLAPGNPEEFYRLLSEADERLLNSGRWAWTRAVLELSATDGLIILPAGYRAICGCRIGTRASGVLWQEIEYLEDGPGQIQVEGVNGQLLDQGLRDVDGVMLRHYVTTSDDITTLTVLARYDAQIIANPSDVPRCQSFSALKQAMMALVFENKNDLERSQGYLQIARDTLDKQEMAYRGTAKKIRPPAQFLPLRRRSRTNFP